MGAGALVQALQRVEVGADAKRAGVLAKTHGLFVARLRWERNATSADVARLVFGAGLAQARAPRRNA